MKTLLFSSLMLAALVLVGEDLTTKSGKVYKNYSISGVTRRGVNVEFADGIANVPLSELPDDLREKYAPEVEKKKVAAKKKADARKRAAGLKKITLDLDGTVKCFNVTKTGLIATHDSYENAFFIDGLKISDYVDGSTIPPNVNGKKGKVLRLYCIGTYSYRDTSGGKTTIPRFTVNTQKASKYLQQHPNSKIIGMQEKQPEVEPVTSSDVLRSMRRENRMRQDHIRFQQRFERRR